MNDDGAPVEDGIDAGTDEAAVASAQRTGSEGNAAAPAGIGIENVVGLILGSPEFQRR